MRNFRRNFSFYNELEIFGCQVFDPHVESLRIYLAVESVERVHHVLVGCFIFREAREKFRMSP